VSEVKQGSINRFFVTRGVDRVNRRNDNKTKQVEGGKGSHFSNGSRSFSSQDFFFFNGTGIFFSLFRQKGCFEPFKSVSSGGKATYETYSRAR